MKNGYPIGIIRKIVSQRGLMDIGKGNTGQCVVFHLPDIVERHCDSERRAFDDVNVVIVYNVRRAFTVMKDVLPINLLSEVV